MPRLNFQQRNECKAFIRNHFGKMTMEEMGKQLAISPTTVGKIAQEIGLSKPPSYHKANRTITHHGNFFNVHAHQDWLIGNQ